MDTRPKLTTFLRDLRQDTNGDTVNWLAHFFGLDNASGAWYLFWSGTGSDIGEVAIFGAVLGMYHRHNCHVSKCWRIQRHTVAGTDYIVCRRHHPTIDGPITAEHIARQIL